MPVFEFNKIVRSRIPDKIIAAGGSYEKGSLTDAEILTFMGEKVLEELVEVRAAPERRLAEEYGDLLEATEGLVYASHLSNETIDLLRQNEFVYDGNIDSYADDAQQTLADIMINDPEFVPQQMAHFKNLIDVMIDASGLTLEEVEEARAIKREEVGDFPLPPHYLTTVTLLETDPWTAKLREQPDRYPEIPE